MTETTELRRAASWCDLQHGTVFMFPSDLCGAELSEEPWRYARMVILLPDCRKGWCSMYTGYAFEDSPRDGEVIVISEPVG